MAEKRFSTYLMAAISLFLAGLEYAVIIPTLNPFLMSINAEPFFVGLCLSAVCLTSLLSSPIYGRIADLTRSTKRLIILSNFFEIGGNIMYLLSTNPYLIVGSRLVVGAGVGSTSCIVSMISRSSTTNERTTLLSRTFASRQTGLLLGAACNFFLRQFDFYIGTCHVNEYTAPGFFMAILWIVQTILMVFFYHDLEYLDKEVDDNIANVNRINDALSINSSSADQISFQKTKNSSYVTNIIHLGKDLFVEEVVVFVTTSFAIMFVQLGIEGILTPLANQLFGWGSLENSIYYTGSGILYVVCLVLLSPLSKKVSDVKLLLFGIFNLFFANLMFLIFVIYAVKEPSGTPWVLAIFILYGVVITLGIGFGWVPHLSLFTKFTSEKNQGFNQGFRFIFMGIGQILGPLWASSLLNNLALMAAVNFALIFFLLLLYLFSYSYLTSREAQVVAKRSRESKEPDQINNA